MKVVLHTFFLSILCLTAVGQRVSLFTHAVTNPYLYNPAFAGYDAHPVLYLTHRQQWMGVEGAPISTNLSFHTPAGNANPVSFGADLTHDRLGIYRFSTFRVSAAYLVPLSAEKEHYFRFGLAAGAALNSYDLQGVNATDDAIFRAAQNAGVFLDGKFGIQYHFERFNLGVTFPQLLPHPSLIDDTSLEGFNQFSQAIGTLNYRFLLNPEGRFSIEPTVLYHYSEEFDPQLEALALLRFGDDFWVGGGYQQQAGIASLIGFQTKSFSFGYHYGLGGNSLASNSFGTHEVQLGLILGKKKAMVKRKPRLTTKANTEALPEAVIEAQKKQEKERERNQRKERKQADQKSNGPANRPTSKPSPTEENIPSDRNSTSDESKIDKNKTTENKVFEEIDNTGNKTIELGESKPTELKDEPRFAKAKRTKSDHPLEMEEGIYLIAGTFSQRANAEKLSQQLISDGYQAKVGYNSDKQYYYVSLMQSAETNSVRDKIQQVRKDPRFSKAWILIIE